MSAPVFPPLERTSASMMFSPILRSLLIATSLVALPALAQEQSAPAPTTSQAPAPLAAPTAEADATAAPVDAQAAAPAAAAATPSAFSEKVLAAIGTPSAGKALVVFFRPSKFVGGAVGFKVRENDVELGKLRNGNYFAIEVDPGQHSYVVHSEAKDVTTIEAEAGETYFLSGSISMGVLAGRPNLSPSDVTAFEAVLGKLKKSKPLD